MPWNDFTTRMWELKRYVTDYSKLLPGTVQLPVKSLSWLKREIMNSLSPNNPLILHNDKHQTVRYIFEENKLNKRKINHGQNWVLTYSLFTIWTLLKIEHIDWSCSKFLELTFRKVCAAHRYKEFRVNLSIEGQKWVWHFQTLMSLAQILKIMLNKET